MSRSELQHVNAKIFAAGPIDLAAAVPVFHRWIRESACEELLIDVADYRHVPHGPGVILVGHEANYSLDESRGRLGLLYNRKAPVSGGPQEVIEQALRAALAACRLLEDEPEFVGQAASLPHNALVFNAGEVELTVNDRLLAPNTEETFRELKPVIESALNGIYGPGQRRIERAGEPRERLRIAVRAERRIRVADVARAGAGCYSGGTL